MDDVTKLLITVTFPAIISCSVTLITLFFKNAWDNRNLHLTFESKYKEIILKRQLECYEKFMSESWLLSVKISEFLYAPDEELAEVINFHKSLIAACNVQKHILPAEIKDKIDEYLNAIQKILDYSVVCKRPVNLDIITDFLCILNKSQESVAGAIKTSLNVK